MNCSLNIPEPLFNKNFWKIVEEENAALLKQKKENNFYVFHKRYTPIYINASNEYDMLLKLHKNTKTFIDDMSIFEEVLSWDDIKNSKIKFETEREFYKYCVVEMLDQFLRQDYHYEKLDVIK